jgi:hypothetical protein
MSNIAIYRNDLQITANQLEQVRIETLFQMGRTKFKEELDPHHKPKDIVNYVFPDGIVEILIDNINGNHYELYISVSTTEHKSKYAFNDILHVVGDAD